MKPNMLFRRGITFVILAISLFAIYSLMEEHDYSGATLTMEKEKVSSSERIYVNLAMGNFSGTQRRYIEVLKRPRDTIALSVIRVADGHSLVRKPDATPVPKMKKSRWVKGHPHLQVINVPKSTVYRMKIRLDDIFDFSLPGEYTVEALYKPHSVQKLDTKVLKAHGIWLGDKKNPLRSNKVSFRVED